MTAGGDGGSFQSSRWFSSNINTQKVEKKVAANEIVPPRPQRRDRAIAVLLCAQTLEAARFVFGRVENPFRLLLAAPNSLTLYAS